MADSLDYALDLMRRLPPQKVEKTLLDVMTLIPDKCADLLGAVDQPLKSARDEKAGRDYLLCDYNRDADSYRSPWTNVYYPPIENGALPSQKLRKQEIEANNAFDKYREMYYDGGLSSVYLWDTENGFAGVIVIKKENDSRLALGCWDSIHVFEVSERPVAKSANYKLTSTIMLWLQTQKENSGYFNLGGSITRTSAKEGFLNESSTISASHITNIGRMVEDMENSVRSILDEVYFCVSRNIVDTMRSISGADEEKRRRALIKEVNTALQKKSSD